MTLASILILLQSALSLLTLVQSAPNLPATFETSAVQIAGEAITAATNYFSTPAATTSTPITASSNACPVSKAPQTACAGTWRAVAGANGCTSYYECSIPLPTAAPIVTTTIIPGSGGSASGIGIDANLNFTWTQSLPITYESPSVNPIGGSELRAIVPFNGSLFASNDYWEDTDSANPDLPGAQIFRLDSANGTWQIDHEFDTVMTTGEHAGEREYYTIASMEAVMFTTDGEGNALPQPVGMLVMGMWSRAHGLDAFARTASGQWLSIPIPGQENAPQGSQIRAFTLYQDPVTHTDIVFAGGDNAIYAGTYSPSRQTIVWNQNPELTLTPTANNPGRVRSFVVANGMLYASVFGSIYERINGTNPSWKLVATVPIQTNSVTGLSDAGFRGMAAIPNPSGSGQVILAYDEGAPGIMYRINPQAADSSGMAQTAVDLNLTDFLESALGTSVNYIIAAYNDMMPYPYPVASCPNLLIGLHLGTPGLAGDWNGKDPNAYYLDRDCNGNYTLHQISDPSVSPQPVLDAVRTLVVSPFSSDPAGTIYAGVFDASGFATHNSAWLYKGVPQ